MGRDGMGWAGGVCFLGEDHVEVSWVGVASYDSGGGGSDWEGAVEG